MLNYLTYSVTVVLKIWEIIKQWPLAPNSPKWQITRANVSRQVTFFSKMANVECERMYRVRGNGWRMSGECIESGKMVGECRANVSSPGKVGWQMSAQAR
jgi:hypothetical protein